MVGVGEMESVGGGCCVCSPVQSSSFAMFSSRVLTSTVDIRRLHVAWIWREERETPGIRREDSDEAYSLLHVALIHYTWRASICRSSGNHTANDRLELTRVRCQIIIYN
jgi:hypothetical protein